MKNEKFEELAIIIPAYNCEKTIERCINSILGQVEINCGIFVIDDGSKDDTRIKVASYLSDTRVKYFYQENRGVSAARNFGIKMAEKYKYLTFIDADDFFEDGFFEKMLLFAEKYDFVFCDWYCYYKSDKNRDYILDNNQVDIKVNDLKKHYLLSRGGGAPWAKVYSNKIIKEHQISFLEGLPYGEDYLFVLEYIQHINSCKYVKEALYGYDCVNIGAGGKFRKNLVDIQIQIEKKKREIIDQPTLADIKYMDSASVDVIGICIINTLRKNFTHKERLKEIKKLREYYLYELGMSYFRVIKTGACIRHKILTLIISY